MWAECFVLVTYIRKKLRLLVSTVIGTAFTTVTLQRSSASNTKPERENDYLNIGHQKCVLCTETEHFPDGTSEMCTVQRDRTLYRRYIRNVYYAQRQGTFQMVHQKCVLCTETDHFQTVLQKCVLCTGTEHFPDRTHKAAFTDQKRYLRTKLADIQSFKYNNISTLHKLKVIHN